MENQPSIRSFFRPSPTSKPQSPQPQTTPQAPPPQRSKPHLPPPPVLKPSSYALPPSATPQPHISTTPSSKEAHQPPPPPQKRKPLLPHQASISPILQTHIPSLRRINALLLPIAYPDSFYANIIDPSCSQHLFSRVIEWEGKVVGGVVCRVDPLSLSNPGAHTESQEEDGEKEIYIQSLTLLSPFRGKGLASFALEEIISLATKCSGVGNVKGLYAHVWTQNEEALEWYGKKGFVKGTAEKDAGSGVGFGGAIHGYYRKLKPDTAFLLRRQLLPSDFLAGKDMDVATSVKTPEVEKEKEEEKRPQMNHTRSFQERGPEREWNDLPIDVVGGNGLLKVNGGSTGSSSRASSRGGEAKMGKKKRVYPAVAFAG